MGMAQLAPFLDARGAAGRRRVEERALELLGEPEALVRRVIVIAAVL
jgi:hypothetical protein